MLHPSVTDKRWFVLEGIGNLGWAGNVIVEEHSVFGRGDS